MEYSNPQLPEGINASQEHPLKEFFWLTASVLAAALLLIVVAVVLADTLATRIPFRVERELTAKYIDTASVSAEMEAYLNALAARLATAEGLPEDMVVRIHYRDDDTVNAFATLGGNIFMFRGLLEKLPHENALAMVLGHEIAHIKHRDPIRGVGRAVVIGLSLSMLSGEAGDAVLQRALSQGTLLTLLKYSRDQERAADAVALEAVRDLYGHTEGAAALFEVLMEAHGTDTEPEIFRSHPLTVERLARTRAAAPATPELSVTALPDGFAGWLTAAAAADASQGGTAGTPQRPGP